LWDINKSPGQGVLLSSNSENIVTIYCDADRVACPITIRFITGYVVKIGSLLVSWEVKKQSIVWRISVEAKYTNFATITTELAWLLGLLYELNVEVKKPVKEFSDSKAPVQLTANPVYHEGKNHIEIDCFFTRYKIQQGLIEVIYIPTQQQPTDILTKGLNIVQHEFVLSKLGFWTSHPSKLEGEC